MPVPFLEQVYRQWPLSANSFKEASKAREGCGTRWPSRMSRAWQPIDGGSDLPAAKGYAMVSVVVGLVEDGVQVLEGAPVPWASCGVTVVEEGGDEPGVPQMPPLL